MKSIVSYPDRGEWGNNRYRGNCSGRLIADIIDQYKLRGLSDFMVGGGEMTLAELYDQMKDSPKTKANRFWQEKIRQTVQDARHFTRTARGTYAAAPHS